MKNEMTRTALLAACEKAKAQIDAIETAVKTPELADDLKAIMTLVDASAFSEVLLRLGQYEG